MRIRKLFPSQSPNYNNPQSCYGSCEPACPFNCYTVAGDFYFIPPPPPPPPPENDQRISPAVIIIVSVLSFTFLLVSYYFIFGKSWLERRRRRSPIHEEGDDPTTEGADDFQFVGQNQVHHPIWHIATVGLQQSVINSITVCKYKKGQGLIEGTECSVCLSEFQEEAMLRLLPKCNHAFHVSCIDTWLRSHTNCPLCRAHIVNEVQPSPVLVSAHQAGSGPNPPAAQMENSEDRAVVTDGGGDRAVTNDNRDGDLKEEDEDRNSGEKVPAVKKLRRSNSMDSLPDAAAILGVCDELGDRGSSRDSSGSSSTAAVSMKRSNSSGGRFFLSRINRSQSVVLPL